MKAKPSHYFLAGLVVIEIAAFMAESRYDSGAFIMATATVGVTMILAGPFFIMADDER